MILEAFSIELQKEENRNNPPEKTLMLWLAKLLRRPAFPGDHVTKVIHTELELVVADGNVSFHPRSASGQRLLKSLYKYCRSYDNWQYTRWLHHVQASDFPLSS